MVTRRQGLYNRVLACSLLACTFGCGSEPKVPAGADDGTPPVIDEGKDSGAPKDAQGGPTDSTSGTGSPEGEQGDK